MLFPADILLPSGDILDQVAYLSEICGKIVIFDTLKFLRTSFPGGGVHIFQPV